MTTPSDGPSGQTARPLAGGQAARVGRAAATTVTLLGVLYTLGLAVVLATSDSGTLRPSAGLQWWAALGTLTICPPIVLLFFCVLGAPGVTRRRAARASSVFATLFALTIIPSRLAFLLWSGDGRHAALLLPAEFIGWGLFLSLAVLCASAGLGSDASATRLRWIGAAYAAFGLSGTAALFARYGAFVIGFVAWGLVLYVWTWQLAVWFRTGTVNARA